MRSVRATCVLEGEGRVAAGEDQAQPVVLQHMILRFLIGRPALHLVLQEKRAKLLLLAGQGLAAAKLIDGLATGGRDDPRIGIHGYAIVGPALYGGNKGLLKGVLSELKVAAACANQGGHDASPVLDSNRLRRATRVRVTRRSTGLLHWGRSRSRGSTHRSP